MKKVVVTGIGMVTPLGNNSQETWARVRAGESGAGKITSFDANGWPVNIGCEVKNFELDSDAFLKEDHCYLNRATEFGLQAGYEAMKDANLDDIDSARLGVCVGTGIGIVRPSDMLNLIRFYEFGSNFVGITAYMEKNPPHCSEVIRNHPATLAHVLARKWKAKSFCTTLSTACTASAQAIGYGLREIRHGNADIALVGGADSLAGELLHAGFCMLGVLSKYEGDPAEASRPFDQSRDGLVISEGGAMLVLESYEHANRRGARIYGELVGYGESENAYRITDLPEDGRGAILAMSLALKDAMLTPTDIDYINAHGTSTEQNDRVEAIAIEKLFYNQNASPWISSTKSETGHLVAAAGAVEAALTVLSVHDQVLPPTRNLKDPIFDRIIRYVRGNEMPTNVRYGLSNSFGFGGTNATLVFGRSE